jgi:hypothetical protein
MGDFHTKKSIFQELHRLDIWWAEAKVFYRDIRGTHKHTINKGA